MAGLLTGFIYSAQVTKTSHKLVMPEAWKAIPMNGFIYHEVANPANIASYNFKVEYQYKDVEITMVNWITTRTGVLIPRIEFAPVTIGLDVIDHCTLPDKECINYFWLNKGSVITVAILNGFAEFVKPYLSSKIKNYPGNCQYCNQVFITDGVCSNQACPGKNLGRLAKFLREISVPEYSYGELRSLCNNGLDTPQKLLLATSAEVQAASSGPSQGPELYIDFVDDTGAPVSEVDYKTSDGDPIYAPLISDGVMDAVLADAFVAKTRLGLTACSFDQFFKGLEIDDLNSLDAIFDPHSCAKTFEGLADLVDLIDTTPNVVYNNRGLINLALQLKGIN